MAFFTGMFSALKKLTVHKNENENVKPAGLQTMSRSLQSKFSKGVQYNMKIIIKGDRNVGKSCLFSRLQGRGFVETYAPTEEIQVTSIQWNYKVTDDVVKVEVWDVVDKGKKRVVSENLKLGNDESKEVLQPALDAEFLNVYKGTHGVILMMDITKSWTFEYVQRELEKIPSTTPVLVLGNHCDMSHHRATTPDHVLFYLETLHRKAPARYAESSMSNGFGLKFLHKWFNLPFLQLQRETLLAQLDTNEKEIDITTQELDLYQQTDDSNYKVYMEKLTSYRRHVADSNSTAPPSSILIQTQHSLTPVATTAAVKEEIDRASKAVESTAVDASSAAPNVARFEDSKKTNSEDKYTSAETPVPITLNASIRNIEEFVPDDHLDKSFLEEMNVHAVNKITLGNESDSEPETVGNPLVAGFQDDLDPEDVFSAKTNESNVSSKCSTLHNLESWMTAESRGSPDGGDDVPKSADNVQSSKDTKTSEEKKKKKSSKKKSKQSSNANDDLENFLNSEYEAL